MTPAIAITLIICTAVVLLGTLAAGAFAFRTQAQQLEASAAARERLAADALRMAASRDYQHFAASRRIEAKADAERPMTDHEIALAAEQLQLRQAAADPFSGG